MTTAPPPRTVPAALLTAAALLALTACGGSATGSKPASGPSKSASATASATAADPQAADKAAVLTAYRGMWRAYAKASAKGSEKGSDLKHYATLNALGTWRLGLARMHQAGTTAHGDIGHAPKVTAISMDRKTPKATLTDCVDISRLRTLKGGKPLPMPSAQPLRYAASATAERWSGRWLITEYAPRGEQRC
ncbi:hypothetical protein ACFW1M_43030 [Streptomyces inhibens]|uniref:hypothetical protein n=1 Tax=Streptomyces inhibens TaxID=2293571 RepID=UPI0036B994DE